MTEPAPLHYAEAVDTGDVFGDGYAIDGSFLDRAVTRPVLEDDPIREPLRLRVIKETERGYFDDATLLLTTEFCWSGYSEYTVTSTWQQVVVTVPEWRYEKAFGGVAEFLRWLLGE